MANSFLDCVNCIYPSTSSHYHILVMLSFCSLRTVMLGKKCKIQITIKSLIITIFYIGSKKLTACLILNDATVQDYYLLLVLPQHIAVPGMNCNSIVHIHTTRQTVHGLGPDSGKCLSIYFTPFVFSTTVRTCLGFNMPKTLVCCCI